MWLENTGSNEERPGVVAGPLADFRKLFRENSLAAKPKSQQTKHAHAKKGNRAGLRNRGGCGCANCRRADVKDVRAEIIAVTVSGEASRRQTNSRYREAECTGLGNAPTGTASSGTSYITIY